MRMCRVPRQLMAAVIIALLCQGCALSFIDSELNNRGGFIDKKLDQHWMVADTKKMRVLRAYILIGSLARMPRDKHYKSERETIVQHISSAIAVASDAYNCAYTRPGECVYFDERMAELESSVARLAIAVFSKEENESLFKVVVDQFSETFPAVKTVTSLPDFLDAIALTSNGQLIANGGKLLQSIIKFAQTGYIVGRRVGALYRDSIELDMITVLTSLDLQFELKKQYADVAAKNEKAIKFKNVAWKTYWQFAGPLGTNLKPCQDFENGLNLWHRGSGDFSDWTNFLDTTALPYRKVVIPNENSFIQASDLIWRACEQMDGDTATIAKCIGHRGAKAEDLECGIDKNGETFAKKRAAEAKDQTAAPTNSNGNADAYAEKEQVFNYLLKHDQCRLILFAKTWDSRQFRRGVADARISWITDLTVPLANQ